ncbi:MAG: C10 family peptidase [Bacteroidetes bacterium]|nr:C10 family peptidase [Bacteroidota bacterium]
MKYFYISLIAILFCAKVDANPIDSTTAKTIAQNYYLRNSNKVINTITIAFIEKATDNTVAYYVFNINENDGWIMVSADDAATPILGYNNEGYFANKTMSPGFNYLIRSYKQQIDVIKQNHIQPTPEINTQWNKYSQLKQGTITTMGTRNISPFGLNNAIVTPLVSTKWDQNRYYNDQCPQDAGAGSYYGYRCPTGCVATAMAQIMKYWNYPNKGFGSHSYTSSYRQEFADFGNTIYDWSAMPLSLTSANSAVATLMYHCGVSVEMNYGPNGSSAYTSGGGASAENALKTYFGYSSSVTTKSRSNYSTDAAWVGLLQTELQAGRPILYRGSDYYDGGHAFVCDGYDADGNFHFNFGWGNYENNPNSCWLNINSINTYINNSTQNWTIGQQAIVGIQKPTNGSTYDLRLYSNITLLPGNTIDFGSTFNATVSIKNYGSAAFSGDISAKVFKSDGTSGGTYIDDIEIKTAQTLQGNNNYTFTFIYPDKKFELTPGVYYLRLYYRPANGNWQSFSGGSFTNYSSFTITYSPEIQLYAQTNFTPENFRQGQLSPVSFNVINTGTSTFYGQYELWLSDFFGNRVQNLGNYSETSGLKSNYRYNNPFTFSEIITVNPGTYLLTVVYKGSDNNWYFAGPGNYQNPILITVLPPVYNYSADPYEVNNTLVQAYNLPVNYTNNSANVYTTGSNFHNSTDVDFYKVVLPSGYNYTISPRLQDSYNSNDGNTYSVDAAFRFSTDGINWSDLIDAVPNGNISIIGGGTVYFHLFPYWQGSTGTYLLQMSISRTVNLIPNAPTGSASQTYCSGATVADLIATGTAIKWYNVVSGGTALLPTTSLVNNSHYYASQTVNGYESQTRLDVTATVNLTATPTGTASQIFCSGTTVSSLLATGSTIKWYTAATGGTVLANTTSLVNGTHYYASQTVNGCESPARLDITPTVNTTAAPTGVASQSYCSGSTVGNLLATGQWYATASGGIALTPITTLINGTHYYASQTANACESSPRLDITVTVNTTVTPKVSITSSANSICSGGTVSFSASPTNGGTSPTYNWYLNSILQTSNTSSFTSTTLNSNASVYCIMTSNSSCITSTTATSTTTSITVNQPPAKPSITKDVNNNLVSSSATGNQWFNGTSPLVGITAQNYKPLIDGYYMVQVTQNGCVSPNSDAYYYVVTAVINISTNETVSIYPNPVKDVLIINYKLLNINSVVAQLYNVNGIKLVENTNISSGSSINMASYATGEYTLRLVNSKTGKIIYTCHIIKVR